MTRILGISAYYHDSAAALVEDGRLVAAAQEERFTRLKHDASFPTNAIRYCLAQRPLEAGDLVVFYEKPLVKFERLLETYYAVAPAGFRQFRLSMPVWLKEKLFLKQELRRSLAPFTEGDVPLLFTRHHESHAASAYYCSPFDDAAVLCVDGVGEWATTSAWHGQGKDLKPLWQIDFPHSLGLLYSTFTAFCGFRVNADEYKLMGLAPYGEPRYMDTILANLIDVKPDGTFRLDMKYFDYCTGTRMFSHEFRTLFGAEERGTDEDLRRLDMDLAASVQAVTDLVMTRLARTVASETGARHLCLAGGVALNCVANGEIWRQGPFERIWVQPAAGDAGGAVGAAFSAWHEHLGNERTLTDDDAMQGSLLGPGWSDDEIETMLNGMGAQFSRYAPGELDDAIAEEIAAGRVIGWFQGRMEFGPRALGSRSIIGDATDPQMQKRLNLSIKGRESFRPFAPAVLAEDASAWFKANIDSPYMTFTDHIDEATRLSVDDTVTGIERVNQVRSSVPAITHLDYSARLQTLAPHRHGALHGLVSAVKRRTQVPMVINTSFNVRDEPIVESPGDALRCFLNTGMDTLVLGSFVLKKEEQPPLEPPARRATEAPAVEASELRSFARQVGGAFLLLALLLAYLVSPLLVLLLVPAIALILTGEIVPERLRNAHRLWFAGAEKLAQFTSPILLGLVFFGVLWPTALARSLVGGQSRFIKSGRDAAAATYRVDADAPSRLSDPF